MSDIDRKARLYATSVDPTGDKAYLVAGYTKGYKEGYNEGLMQGCNSTLERLEVVDANGEPVKAETLKNACDIVRVTTKQRLIANTISYWRKALREYKVPLELFEEYEKNINEKVL